MKLLVTPDKVLLTTAPEPIYFAIVKGFSKFITFSLLCVGFSASVYLKICRKWRTLEFMGVSRDFEFMRTRRSFPTPMSFCLSSHPPLHPFSPLIICTSHPQSSEGGFQSSSSFKLPTPHPLPLHPRHSLNISAVRRSQTQRHFGCSPLAPSSFHSLASVLLNQPNCYPPLHLHVCSFISPRLHHVFCSVIIALCLNQLYRTYIHLR